MKRAFKHRGVLLWLVVICAATVTHMIARVTDSAPGAKRKALLIGIGKYDDPSFPSLPYPQNDVARMAELLGANSPQYSFDVMTMTDQDADPQKRPTHDNIKTAIKTFLVDGAKPGDVRLLYYSGHGSWIKNSLSDEDDRRDETLVPMDAVRPVSRKEDLKDIRDKELVEWLNPILNKRIALTIILDSCHSGSAAKAIDPSKEVAGVDSFDFYEKPNRIQQKKPEEHGALVLTAAKDYQVAGGRTMELNNIEAKYSYLTAGLLRALYRTPAHLISAEALFQETAARMSSEGMTGQTPEIKGTELRKAQTIFGGTTGASSGRVTAVVETQKVEPAKTETRKYLRRGIADGLENGVELQRVTPRTPEVRIRITNAGLTRSEFDTVGTRHTVNDADVFEQVTWITKGEPDLTIWVPPAILSDAQLRSAVEELQKPESGLLAADPTGEPVPAIVLPERTGTRPAWRIRGGDPSANIVEAIAKGRAKGRDETHSVFVNLPPSETLHTALLAELARDKGRIVVADTPDKAAYELVGRVRKESGRIEYGWVLRSAMADENPTVKALLKGRPEPSSLPKLTKWIADGEAQGTTNELKTLALKLGKIRRLINLTSPITMGSKKFPYQLRVRHSRTGRFVPSGSEIKVTEPHDYVLRRTRLSTDAPSQFFAYLINIGPTGSSKVKKFEFGQGSGEGGRRFDPSRPDLELVLFKGLVRSDPKPGSLGSDTLILLVTDDELSSEDALQFMGVNDAIDEKGIDSLADLLKGLGMELSAKGTTPDTWAVQRLVFTSVR